MHILLAIKLGMAKRSGSCSNLLHCTNTCVAYYREIVMLHNSIINYTRS